MMLYKRDEIHQVIRKRRTLCSWCMASIVVVIIATISGGFYAFVDVMIGWFFGSRAMLACADYKLTYDGRRDLEGR